jgi:ribonucleotide monophosphatase NagD (HAD superfamily)
MDIEHMPPGFEGENNNIAIDFDGVIHEFKGWGDGTCYGKPLEGALEAIKLLSKKYNVIIFTAKSKPNRPLVEGKTGTELVWEWLKKHNIDQYIKEVTAEKPRACLYIDDKGFRFINWVDTLQFVNSL